jgi:hypothetical protein
MFKAIIVLLFLISSQSFAYNIKHTKKKVESSPAPGVSATVSDKVSAAKASRAAQLKADFDKQFAEVKKQMSDLDARMTSLESKANDANKDAMVVPEASAEPQVEVAAVAAPVAAPFPPPVAPPVAVAKVAQALPADTFEGRHVSFRDGFWVFETAGYTLICESACPQLKQIDAFKPLLVHAKTGTVDFQSSSGPKTCPVNMCKPAP